MTEDDTRRIVMLAAGYQEKDTIFPGSIKTTADCTHECWISPSMRKHVIEWKKDADVVVKTMCEDCVMKDDKMVAELMEEGVQLPESSAAELRKAGYDPMREAGKMGLKVKIRPDNELTKTEPAEEVKEPKPTFHDKLRGFLNPS